jgi:hypothetical protein
MDGPPVSGAENETMDMLGRQRNFDFGEFQHGG